MKYYLFAAATVLLFASCSHGWGDEKTAANTVSEDEIHANVKKVFGVNFHPNHDWCTTVTGEVTINADASVKKVQLLAYVSDIFDENVPEDATRNQMKVLNEAQTNGRTTIKLKYDAPKENLGLFVAFTTDHGLMVQKVTNNTASFNDSSQSRVTRTLSTGYTLPVGVFTIDTIFKSYAAERGWIPNERLYAMNDYTSQKMTPTDPDYSIGFKEIFRGIVFTYFPNGRNYNNLPKVKASGYYNDKVYPITTGEEPIIVTPVYKCDQAERYGNEVYNSDLYYYYFKEEDLPSDTVAYLESLPKFKAIPFNQCFGVKEDDVIGKHGSYALMYFGDGTPEIGTEGSYQFPQGYKLGFMVRAKTTYENGKKQGEVYGDGRLNNRINTYDKCNFRSSNLGANGPRSAWLSLNGKLFMCWESGTDRDFNDVIMEVEGGIEPMDYLPDFDPEVYTYCFEDSPIGDYDMNDIVIKAIRVDETHVKYSIVACGGFDRLCVRNINYGVIKDNAEVHALFGLQPNMFINTDGSNIRQPISVTKPVSASFSFLDPATFPSIYDMDHDVLVKISEEGEDPHGIIIPGDFLYPKEKICIKDAYRQFNSWGENPVNSVLWYTSPNSTRVYYGKFDEE